MRTASCNSYFLFIICYLLLTGQQLLSAQEVFDHPLDSRNLPGYTAICNELAGNKYIKGSFTLIRTPRRGRSMESNGYFIINTGTGIVWDTRSPVLSTMTVGRDFIIQTIPGKPRSITNTSGNQVFLSMAETFDAVFTGKSGQLQEKFDNYFVSAISGDFSIWTIGLIPKERTMRNFIDRIILEGTGGNGNGQTKITSISMFEPSGNCTSYYLSNHSYPDELSNDEKSFFSVE